jgi:hypothetical protein
LSHYLSLTEDLFAPPQLHFDMGLGHTAIDEFAEFVDEECEPVTLREEKTRTRVKTNIASIESIRKTREIEEVGSKASLQEIRIFIRNLKKQHKKEKDPVTKDQLKNEVALAETEKKALEKDMKSRVQFVSDVFEELARIKKELADMAKARGSTKKSIANGIEAIPKIFGASKESYHGGDYNGGLIRLIVRYAKEIGELILALLLERSKSGDASEDHPVNVRKQLLDLLVNKCGRVFICSGKFTHPLNMSVKI